jgi:ATP-binding cassette, subfamily C, bacterial
MIRLGFNRAPRRIKTPALLQMERVECGAVALGIVLAYHGRIVPLPELRVYCGVSRDGSTMAAIVKAAQHFGLRAKGFRKAAEALRVIQPPYIVHWQGCHFVVVEGFRGDRLWINDPQTGSRSLSLTEFQASYSGVVLVLEPSPEFQRSGRFPSTIFSLWQRLRGSLIPLIFSILVNLVLVLPGMAIAVFAQVFIDQIFIQERTEWIWPMLGMMAGVTFIQTSLLAVQLQKLRFLQLRLTIQLTSQFFWHTLCLPIEFYAQRFAGEISSRVDLNEEVAGLLSGRLARSAIDGITASCYLTLMWFYDPLLTAIVIGSVVSNFAILHWVNRQRQDAYTRLNLDGGKLAGIEISALRNLESLKASALESSFFAKWASYYALSVSRQQQLFKSDLWLNTLPLLLGSISSSLLLVIGGLRIMDGALTIGMLIAFQALINRVQPPISNLLDLVRRIQTIGGNLYRLEDVLQHQTDVTLQTSITTHLPSQLSGQTNSQKPIKQLQGNLELRHISFGYNPLGQPFIQDFNCTLNAGERIALVGASGSGKSTLARLIAGLYQPLEGEILFDGIPRRDLPRTLLTSALALVEQEIFIFGGTIRDNLTLWDHTIPDTQLLQACRDAEFLDVIRAMPKGLESELLEGGANLSGGQRQRLEIARALVQNPSLLILDEATSALDATTELAIDHHLRRRGCSCVIIAHRLSTIRDCDEIIVFDQGQAIERGTHDTLLALDSHYARLWRSA